MQTVNPNNSQTAERGAAIYEERLRQVLEPVHNGKYLVIDVETGEYELDADHLAASDRAAAKRPGAPLYATRVGSRSLGRIGGRISPKRP
ncbi:MAG TPA: hypothetical protein VL992_09625 [Tepidisphaeraceae bacterium]|nr:hypothetical protein [Tepidisphaeraceae bacterium]